MCAPETGNCEYGAYCDYPKNTVEGVIGKYCEDITNGLVAAKGHCIAWLKCLLTSCGNGECKTPNTLVGQGSNPTGGAQRQPSFSQLLQESGWGPTLGPHQPISGQLNLENAFTDSANPASQSQTYPATNFGQFMKTVSDTGVPSPYEQAAAKSTGDQLPTKVFWSGAENFLSPPPSGTVGNGGRSDSIEPAVSKDVYDASQSTFQEPSADTGPSLKETENELYKARIAQAERDYPPSPPPPPSPWWEIVQAYYKDMQNNFFTRAVPTPEPAFDVFSMGGQSITQQILDAQTPNNRVNSTFSELPPTSQDILGHAFGALSPVNNPDLESALRREYQGLFAPAVEPAKPEPESIWTSLERPMLAAYGVVRNWLDGVISI